jgi:hypothetical protein
VGYLCQFPPKVGGNVPIPTGCQICTLPREERPLSHFQLIRTHALEGVKHAVDQIDHEQVRCQVIQCLAIASSRVEDLVGRSQEHEHHRMVIRSRIHRAAAAIVIVVEGEVLPMPTSDLPKIPQQIQVLSSPLVLPFISFTILAVVVLSHNSLQPNLLPFLSLICEIATRVTLSWA